jgi:hypothetical protein
MAYAVQGICVFCSSSDGIGRHFFAVATELGSKMAKRGQVLYYGGASVGLMGAVARAVHANGGSVVGVLPEGLRLKEIAYEDADELVITKDLRDRKAILQERADAFIALPGGFGTLEEAVELLTLKQLGFHQKPIVFLNAAGFYDPLIHVFEHMYRERFARESNRELYEIATTVDEALALIDRYEPSEPGHKWY